MRTLCLFLVAFTGSVEAATYYISSSIGDDTRTSTQAQNPATPWAHLPGMNGCTSNCAAKTPAADDRFVLRGGDTFQVPSSWNCVSGNCPSHTWINWQWSGTSGHNIYVGNSGSGADASFYAGASWSRPKFWGGNAITTTPPQYCTVDNTNTNWFLVNQSYVTVDNIEWYGLCTSDDVGEMLNFGAGTNLVLSNHYVHGWSHATFMCPSPPSGCTGTSDGNNLVDDYWLFGGSSSQSGNAGVRILYNVFDGEDTSKDWGIPIKPGGYEIAYNIFRYASNFVIANNVHSFHDNLLEYKIISYNVGPSHGNTYEENSESAAVGTNYVYNNVLRHNQNGSDSGDVNFWPAIPPGLTEWIFNNVFYDDNNCLTGSGGNFFLLQTATSGTNGTARIANNTLANGNCQIHPSNIALNVSAQNNHFITLQSLNFTSQFQNSTSSPLTDQGGHVYMTPTTATSQGYVSSNSYAPTSGSNSTVGTGNNLTSSCSGELAPLCSDTTYACSYDTTNHKPVCPARTPVTRPSTGAWDAGAYQYASASPLSITTSSLPNATRGVPYSQTISTSGGTPPVTCSVTSGALPTGLTLNSNCTITGTPQ
jgi:hypothetical protein